MFSNTTPYNIIVQFIIFKKLLILKRGREKSDRKEERKQHEQEEITPARGGDTNTDTDTDLPTAAAAALRYQLPQCGHLPPAEWLLVEGAVPVLPAREQTRAQRVHWVPLSLPQSHLFQQV